VLRPQATQNATQTPQDWKYYNCEEKCHYFNRCPNPCIHCPSVLITNIAPTSSEKTVKVCFHCGQRCHFALQCSDRCQWQTPPEKKCYNCEEKGHFANACPNPRSRPPLPPTKTALNHKRGSMSVKATMSCFNYGQVGHFVNRCPDLHQLSTPKATRIWHKLQPMRSATTVDKRVTLLMYVPINDTALMWQR
jgi:hypothetical protein